MSRHLRFGPRFLQNPVDSDSLLQMDGYLVLLGVRSSHSNQNTAVTDAFRFVLYFKGWEHFWNVTYPLTCPDEGSQIGWDAKILRDG